MIGEFPSIDRRGQTHTITARNVKDRLTKITTEEDRSRHLL